MAFGERAPALWHLGWSAIPLRGKVPLVKDWSRWNERLPDHEERVELLRDHGDAENIGVAVGTPQGLIVPVLRDADVGAAARHEGRRRRLPGPGPRSLSHMRCGLVQSDSTHIAQLHSCTVISVSPAVET